MKYFILLSVLFSNLAYCFEIAEKKLVGGFRYVRMTDKVNGQYIVCYSMHYQPGNTIDPPNCFLLDDPIELPEKIIKKKLAKSKEK